MKGLFLILGLILIFSLQFTTSAPALEGPMADEFSALSSQTRQAMDLSVDEINALLKRCTLLQEQVTELKGSARKIMTKRLRRLCAVYDYVLQSKQAAEKTMNNDPEK